MMVWFRIIDSPNVTSATSMCERCCSGRSTAYSNTTPTSAISSGTASSATQKPMRADSA